MIPNFEEQKKFDEIISSESVEKIATAAMSGTFKKASEHLMRDFYDACNAYLYEHFTNFRDDIWREVSNQIIRGYNNGRWSKYNHKELRETLFREHREEIIKDIAQDIVEENKKLKEDLAREREWNRTRF